MCDHTQPQITQTTCAGRQSCVQLSFQGGNDTSQRVWGAQPCAWRSFWMGYWTMGGCRQFIRSEGRCLPFRSFPSPFLRPPLPLPDGLSLPESPLHGGCLGAAPLYPRLPLRRPHTAEHLPWNFLSPSRMAGTLQALVGSEREAPSQ